jgi:anti-sigma factor RsiW
MAESVSRAEIALPARRAFARTTALRNHERLIPLTRIDAPARQPRVGDVVTATSALLLRDVMEVADYEEPSGDSPGDGAGRARWVKRGPVLLGEAEIVVTPVAPDRSLVEWFERDIHLSVGPPALTTSLLTALTGVMTSRALRLLVRLSDATR